MSYKLTSTPMGILAGDFFPAVGIGSLKDEQGNTAQGFKLTSADGTVRNINLGEWLSLYGRSFLITQGDGISPLQEMINGSNSVESAGNTNPPNLNQNNKARPRG